MFSLDNKCVDCGVITTYSWLPMCPRCTQYYIEWKDYKKEYAKKLPTVKGESDVEK